MPNALTTIGKGGNSQSSDINQVIGVLNGTVDAGQLQLFTQIPAPSTAPTDALNGAGNLTGTYAHVVTFLTGVQASNGSQSYAGETTVGAPSTSVTASAQQINTSAIPTGPTGTIARRLYRNKSNGSATTGPWYLVTTITDNTTTTFPDNVTDASLGAQAPSANTTGTYGLGRSPLTNPLTYAL